MSPLACLLLLAFQWLERKPPLTMYGYLRTLSSVLSLLELQRPWTAYFRQDRDLIRKNDMTYEVAKISISLYIPM